MIPVTQAFSELASVRPEISNADEQWQWLGQQYQYVNMGPYVIMPNHIQALIGIVNPVGNGLDRSAHTTDASSVDGGRVEPRPYAAHSLSTLVAFKTTSSKAIHLAGHEQFRWQKSFHDSIVRNDNSAENSGSGLGICNSHLNSPIKLQIPRPGTMILQGLKAHTSACTGPQAGIQARFMRGPLGVSSSTQPFSFRASRIASAR